MSIATQISALQSDKTAIANAITAKGGTVNSGDGFDDFATDIGTIPTGGTSTKYGCSIDNILGDVNSSGVLQAPSGGDVNLVFTGVEDIDSGVLRNEFYGDVNIKSVDLSDLTSLSGSHAMYYCFAECSNLTSVDLSKLGSVSGNGVLSYAFYNSGISGALDLSSLTTVSGSTSMQYCFGTNSDLTSVDLSGLTTVSGENGMSSCFSSSRMLESADLSGLTSVNGRAGMSSLFNGCVKLATISFPNLTIIGTNDSSVNNAHFSSAFYNCNLLTSLTFTKLEKIYCTGGNTATLGTFYNNNKIQKFYFPKLNTITYGSGASTTNRNACKYVFNGCNALTEIHFGASNRTAIEASPGYSTIWGRGAGNATIYFDL